MDSTKLSSADEARFRRDLAAKGGDVAATQGRQWVREANAYTAKLAAEGEGATAETRTAFWIRVCGVLGEVHTKIADQRDMLAEWLAASSIAEPSEQNARLRKIYHEPLTALADRIAEAKAVLNADEMLYLLHRRDVECHPWQDAYRIRSRTDRLLDTRGVFGKTWTVEEMDAALKKLLLQYRLNESAIAASFAIRLAQPVARVFEASERWYGAVG